MVKKIWSIKFFRFLAVGLLNAVFGYSVFALFIFLSLNYALAITLATIIGILFNFKTVGVIVFKSHNNNLILKFFLVYIVVYLFNLIGLWIFNGYHVNNYVAGAILILPAAIIGFLLNQKFVFKSTDLESVKTTNNVQ